MAQEFSNSPLVDYTLFAPKNKWGKRNAPLWYITVHQIYGCMSPEDLGAMEYYGTRVVTSNYGIGPDGRIGQYVDESEGAWTSNSELNDRRAITIECSSYKEYPNQFPDACYQALIRLIIDICQRNGKKKLLWIPDKNKALAYQVADDELLLTCHFWFLDTQCPGQWMYDRLPELAQTVTAALAQEAPPAESAPETDEPETDADSPEIVEPPTDPMAYDSPPAAVGLQGRDIAQMGIDKALKILGPIFADEQRKYGLLASVMLAQAIAESGLNSDLFQYANAAFGMHCLISGNTWKGTVWDGESSYVKNGDYYRAYPSLECCIEDHRNYLLNAMNGDAPRYAGLAGCTDAREAAQIIYDGGYCDNPRYVEALLYYIELYDLDCWNAVPDVSDPAEESQAANEGNTGLDDGTVTMSREDFDILRAAVSLGAQTIAKYEGTM